MPTWRKLHTKIIESIDVNDMPDDFTRLLWVFLPTQLCREGRGVDNPSWVRARVFPLREDVTIEMIGAAMDWYEQRGMIARYQVSGRSYFCVPTFRRYQGNTLRESASEYPAPPDECAHNARPTHEQCMTNSRTDVDADVDVDVDVDAKRPPVAAAILLWEAAAGRLISPVEAREILADVETYPEDQIEYAIREAARQNVLRWAYVQGILRGGCKGLGRDRARASPPPPVQVLEGGAVILPYMGGSGSDNARRR